ncbi:hypothetical protein HDU96_007709 [Phlyctochytrium bullatum]|nr:hypothetical protein HDU96_007709 [Phlyctochytrium bullatum]
MLSRYLTIWQVWAHFASIRASWLELEAESDRSSGAHPKSQAELLVEAFRPCLLKKCGATWSQIGLKYAKANPTYLLPYLSEMYNGSIALSTGNVRKAIKLWNHMVSLSLYLEEGNAPAYSNMLGQFREPLEWRGTVFLRYQRMLMVHRVTVLEALETVQAVVMLRRKLFGKKNPSHTKVFPSGTAFFASECDVLVEKLDALSKRLEFFGKTGALDIHMLNAVSSFINDLISAESCFCTQRQPRDIQ